MFHFAIIFNAVIVNLLKMTVSPFNTSSSPFKLIHTNLWGPSLIVTKGCSMYYVSFVDDFSRFTWIYLMTRKSDFFKNYNSFHNMVQIQFSTTIKVLHSNLGGESY